MSEYHISYVLTAHNSQATLRLVIERLVAARQANEEIVVIDGASDDGTPEYLHQLHTSGHIQQFLSEPQKNEAHGLNKGMVMARGRVIKIITLHDAFCLQAIREAKDFMLAHPEVDVLAGNSGTLALPDTDTIRVHHESEANFKRWFEHKATVPLVGLSLLIRREALALTGFFHTGVTQVDMEFTYRLTSLNVGLAWSTALLAVRVYEPQNGPPPATAKAHFVETERLEFFHDKQQGNRTLHRIWRKSSWAVMLQKRKSHQAPQGLEVVMAYPVDVNSRSGLIDTSEATMSRYNAEHPTKFIFRAQQITKAFQKPS